MDPPPADVRGEALERVIYDGGYLEWACTREPERADDRGANLISLIDSASTLAGPSLDLIEFPEAWSLAGGGDLGRGEGVRLMTIHAPKGLNLRLSACRGGMRACSRCPTQKANVLTSSRRSGASSIAALTRARDRAVITWAQSRMHHGRTLPGRPSRFIAEIAGEGAQGLRTSSARWAQALRTDDAEPAAQRPTSARDELAQFDYGDREGASTPGDADPRALRVWGDSVAAGVRREHEGGGAVYRRQRPNHHRLVLTA